MNRSGNFTLPDHDPRTYEAVGVCIYCGSANNPTKEHIIPYSAGGRWVLPQSSCKACAAITGAFEGEFARTILGPLRMLYNMPTRRPKDRPKHLPLKIKYAPDDDWEIAYVDRSICPFLVGLPLYPLPEKMTGEPVDGDRGHATKQLWIRGGGFWPNRDAHMQWLCNMLKAVEIMPVATVHTKPFCLTLTKVAHAFAVAELGPNGFTPILADVIRTRDLTDRAAFFGGGRGDEAPSDRLFSLGSPL